MSLRKLKKNTESETETIVVEEEPTLSHDEEMAAEVEIVKAESEIEDASDAIVEAEDLTSQLENKIGEIKESLQTAEKEAETAGEEPVVDPIDVAVVQENLKHFYYVAGLEKDGISLSKEDITSNSYASMKMNLEEAESLLGKIKGTAKDIWEKIKKFFRKLWEKLLSILPGKSKKVKAAATETVKNIKDVESKPEVKKKVEEVLEVIVEEADKPSEKDKDWNKIFNLAEKAAIDYVYNMNRTFNNIREEANKNMNEHLNKTKELSERLDKITQGLIEPKENVINTQCDKFDKALHYAGVIMRIVDNDPKVLLEEAAIYQKTIADLSKFFTEMIPLSDAEKVERIFNNKPNITLYGMKYDGTEHVFNKILKSEGILQEDDRYRVIPIGARPHITSYDRVSGHDLLKFSTDNIYIVAKKEKRSDDKTEYIHFTTRSFPGSVERKLSDYKSLDSIKKINEFLASNQLDQYVKQCKSSIDALSKTVSDIDKKIGNFELSGFIGAVSDVLRLVRYDYDLLLNSDIVSAFASSVK